MIMIRPSPSISGPIPMPMPISMCDDGGWRWRLITPETALLISALRAFLIFFRWSPSFLRLTS